MKRYYSKESTPLKFHKFFCYVFMPISLFSCFAIISNLYTGYDLNNWGVQIDMVYALASLALIFVILFGFRKWKPSAWYGIIVYLSLQMLYRLLVVVVYYISLTQYDAAGYLNNGISQFLGICTYCIPVIVYYSKRKPLFFTSSVYRTFQENELMAEKRQGN